jgi:hypothetical protein
MVEQGSKGANNMKASEAVRKVMELTKTRVADIAFMTNKKQNVISERLTQENISVAKLNEMLRVMNYKIVIVPRETRIPDRGFEIE